MPEEVASALHLHLLRELQLASGLLRRARTQLEVALKNVGYREIMGIPWVMDLSWGYSWDIIDAMFHHFLLLRLLIESIGVKPNHTSLTLTLTHQHLNKRAQTKIRYRAPRDA